MIELVLSLVKVLRSFKTAWGKGQLGVTASVGD